MPIQRETPTGLVDTVCNGDVDDNSAGLCRLDSFPIFSQVGLWCLCTCTAMMVFYFFSLRNHYAEYLCFLIRKNNIETMPILSACDLETVVRRADKRMPPRPYGILETFYRRELIKVKINSKPKFN